MAAGLLLLAQRRQPDRVGLTAAIDAEGRLQPVAGLAQKITAAMGTILKVIVCPQDFEAVEAQARIQKQEVKVIKAATVHDALPHLLGLAPDVSRYLEGLGTLFTRVSESASPATELFDDNLYIERTMKRVAPEEVS